MDVIVTKAERSDRRSENRGGRGRRTYGIARAMIDIVLLVKLYRAAALLKFLQEIKILEPLTTMASGVFTASVYSFTMKVSLVVALVVSYAVHEFGHFFATKFRGLTANWWIFFPFAGQLMDAPDFRSRDDEAYIAYGGPLVGGAFSFLLFIAWLILPLPNEWGNILYTTAFLSTLLNLFNMIPVSPLDGGRITEGVSIWFRVVGFIGLIVLSFYEKQASMLLVWMLIISQVRMLPMRRLIVASAMLALMGLLILLGFHGNSVFEDWCFFAVASWLVLSFYRQRNAPERGEDYRDVQLTPAQRKKWAGLYVALLAALLGLGALHLPHLSRLVL